MPKRRVIAYIDGFNFYYRRLRNKPFRWLDLVAFVEQFFPDDEVVKVKYFTARVGGKFDAKKPLRQQTYLRALSTLPKLEIIEGKFLTKQVKYRLVKPLVLVSGEGIESVEVWRPEEKGSDVSLGVTMLDDAWEDAYDVAAILTNDSDLAIAMKAVIRREKTVILLRPDDNSATSLIAHATEALNIHDKHLRDSQLPVMLTLPNGKTIKKPEGF